MGAADPGGAGRVGAARDMLRGRIADVRRVVPGSALARTATLVLAVQVVTGVVRYLIQILFARRGGPVEFGMYSFAFGWTQLLVVPATLGLTLSVLRFVPEYIHEERWGLLRGLIRRSCQVTVFSGVVFSAVAIAVVLVVGTGSSQPSLLLGMALIGVVGLATVLRETTRGTHRVVMAYGIGDLLPMGLILIAAAALPAAAGHISAEQMLLATGIGFLLALAVQPFTLRRAVPRAFAPGVRPSYELQTWLILSLPLWLVTLFTLLINQSDLLVLGVLKSPDEVGIYAAGSKTAYLVSFVLTAVSAVLAPVFVRHHAAGDIASLRSAMRSGMRLILWPSLAIGGVLFLWPELILGAFGPDFESASTIVRILVVGQFVNAVTGPAGYLLLLTGSQSTVAKVYGFSAVAQILLLLAFVPGFGTNGAAIVTATTITVSNCLLYAFARRRLERGSAGKMQA
jgi:O-antigen/teichoic acid export membrane protein